MIQPHLLGKNFVKRHTARFLPSWTIYSGGCMGMGIWELSMLEQTLQWIGNLKIVLRNKIGSRELAVRTWRVMGSDIITGNKIILRYFMSLRVIGYRIETEFWVQYTMSSQWSPLDCCRQSFDYSCIIDYPWDSTTIHTFWSTLCACKYICLCACTLMLQSHSISGALGWNWPCRVAICINHSNARKTCAIKAQAKRIIKHYCYCKAIMQM